MPSLLATIIFVLFTLLSVAGAYLIGAHFFDRRRGLVAGLAVLAFFAALAAAMYVLLASYPEP